MTPATGASYAWLVSSTAMVNHYYFYAVDEDFGPFFLKFCSYFPYIAKLWHQRARISEAAVDQAGHRVRAARQRHPELLGPRGDAAAGRRPGGRTRSTLLLRKWLARLPHPFEASDRQQGIRYDISMLQAEFARTEVFDRPVQGRVFFEEVLRARTSTWARHPTTCS